MIKKLLSSLFSSNPNKPSAGAKAHAGYQYKGITITPTPQSVKGGWSTEATLSKQQDEDTLQHHFIRADVSPSEEQALELIEHKTQRMIDQMGDGVFSDPRQ